MSNRLRWSMHSIHVRLQQVGLSIGSWRWLWFCMIYCRSKIATTFLSAELSRLVKAPVRQSNNRHSCIKRRSISWLHFMGACSGSGMQYNLYVSLQRTVGAGKIKSGTWNHVTLIYLQWFQSLKVWNYNKYCLQCYRWKDDDQLGIIPGILPTS